MKEKNNVAFTEEEALTDVLILEKNLVRLYATALTESANKPLRTLLLNAYKEINSDQSETFSLMQKLGFYELKPCDKAMLDQKRDSFSKMLSKMQ